jgi:hypothetical protein
MSSFLVSITSKIPPKVYIYLFLASSLFASVGVAFYIGRIKGEASVREACEKEKSENQIIIQNENIQHLQTTKSIIRKNSSLERDALIDKL